MMLVEKLVMVEKANVTVLVINPAAVGWTITVMWAISPISNGMLNATTLPLVVMIPAEDVSAMVALTNVE